MTKPLLASESQQFILAGKAIVTLKSRHFTYRIIKKKDADIWFVSNMYDYTNQKYSYLGIIKPNLTFIHTKASQRRANTPSWQAP